MPRHLVAILVLLAAFLGFLLLTADGWEAPTAAVEPAPRPTATAPDSTLPGSRGPVDAPTDLGAFVAEPPRFQTEGLRLATFNVEFLFDGEEPEGQADFPWKGNPEAARKHRLGVGRIIRLLDADVVVLQEVEHEGVVRAMVEETLADLGYTVHVVPGRDTFTRQDLALLARVPVEAVGRTDERARVAGTRQEYGVSKNLWARVDLGGVPTTLIGVHFLSRPDDPARAPQREAQAEVIRRLVVAERAAGREVVLLGDLNDFDPDVPDRRGSVPTARTLAILKGADTAHPLHNAMKNAPRTRRFTAFWDRNRNDAIEEGELSAIDHVLLSEGLYRRLREVTFVHAHDPRHGPDHFPVVVTLDLPRPTR